MKYLHIMPDSIYSKDYVERVNKIYDSEEHFFVIMQWDGKRNYYIKNGILTDKINHKQMGKIIKLSIYAEQVIFHSLYIDKTMHVIFSIFAILMPHKFSWYVWSSDLYKEYKSEQQMKGIALKKRVKRLCRTCIIRHLHKIIVVAEGDYLFAKKVYKTRATMVQAEYAYNLIDIETDNYPKEYIGILAGHNASPGLQHKEMYNRLSFLATEPVKIFSILSYPEVGEFVDEIMSCGYQIFGEKYQPITEWMPYDEYIELLCKVEVALFEGDCQNGAGNIFNLIYLGKKVYLSKDNSIYNQLRKSGILCFPKEEIQKSFYTALTDVEKSNNKEIMRKLLSEKTFKKKWDKVFE